MNSLQVGRDRYPVADNNCDTSILNRFKDSDRKTSGKVAYAATGGFLFVERLKLQVRHVIPGRYSQIGNRSHVVLTTARSQSVFT